MEFFWHDFVRVVVLTVAFVFCTCAATANAEELDPQLNERVLMLPGAPERPVSLQVTVFSPPSTGPFPLPVINHGKNLGEPRDEPRWRAPYIARYFLALGYAVAIPMARGFAGSGGSFDSMDCDAEGDGLAKAQDVRGVILALEKESFVDSHRVVVVGQSYGGWTTLALGALEVPGVKALVNFAGGRRAARCPGYRSDLSTAAGHYGGRTTEPSIWFYGDNDQAFAPDIWHAMVAQHGVCAVRDGCRRLVRHAGRQAGATGDAEQQPREPPDTPVLAPLFPLYREQYPDVQLEVP